MQRDNSTGHSALGTFVIVLATVTMALGGLGSGCGSKRQTLNNRGNLPQVQVESQTNNGDATADQQSKGPQMDPTPTAVPQNNTEPLPMSNLTWDGKSTMGTPDLQLVPLN